MTNYVDEYEYYKDELHFCIQKQKILFKELECFSKYYTVENTQKIRRDIDNLTREEVSIEEMLKSLYLPYLVEKYVQLTEKLTL